MNERSDRDSHGDGPEKPSSNRRASEWLVLLESGDATEEDRARFEAWLAEDQRHREAYAGLTETWGRLTVMRGRARAAGGEPGRDPDLQGPELSRRSRRRTYRWTWAAAAAVLVAAFLAGILSLPGDAEIRYRTDVGERRTVSLADGSTLELNTDTEVVVEYTDERRRVDMLRGEAFFDVVEDADRPFVVAAGQGAIRAVGTGFAVRVEPAGMVSVMVTEGLVEVVHLGGGLSDTARPGDNVERPVLQRGQRAQYDREAPRIEEITPEELERTQAWRRGLLVFEDASLAEVVAEVNRYTETRLVIADPTISVLRLGGTFKTGRVEALLDVLEKGFGVRVERANATTIELHAASRDPLP